MGRLIIYFPVLFFTAALCSCANIVPPSGGVRDTVPPRLVRATPADSTLNFRGNTIRLDFDEYIVLKDATTNIQYSPVFPVDKMPSVDGKLRSVVIRFKDTLEANTTYTINFGKSLTDFNEGNEARAFTYTFSTGPRIDTLTLSGQVIVAETGGIDSTITVLLHRNLDDSAVIKEAPRFATTVDNKGAFTFRNLPAGRYALYALGDAGMQRRYQNKSSFFGFVDHPVRTDSANGNLTIYVYKEAAKPAATAAPKGAAGNPTDRRLRYTSNLAGNQQDLLKDLVLAFERPLRHLDTTAIRFTVDSNFTPVPFRATLDSTNKLLTIKTEWQDGRDYGLLLQPAFGEDTTGRKLTRTDTLRFTTKKRSDYGNLQIRVKNVAAYTNPVLQFVQGGAVVLSVPLVNGRYGNPLFNPGDYELRILEDRNSNGKWDAGEFFGVHRQPERVHPVDRRITVKANWDNEIVL